MSIHVFSSFCHHKQRCIKHFYIHFMHWGFCFYMIDPCNLYLLSPRKYIFFNLNASCQIAFWQGTNTSYFYQQCRKIPFSLHALKKYLNQLVLIYVIFLLSLEIISSFCAKWCDGRQRRERLRKSHSVRQYSVWSSHLFSKYFSGTYSRWWNCKRHWSNLKIYIYISP